MGGGDEEENIVELTIEEHAEAHRILWEQHGFREDYIAWKALSGQMTMPEIRREVGKNALKRYYETHDFHKPWLGKTRPESTRDKIRAARKRQAPPDAEARKKMSDAGKKLKGISKSDSHKAALRDAALKRTKAPCSVCGAEFTPAMLNRWHNDNCRRKV